MSPSPFTTREPAQYHPSGSSDARTWPGGLRVGDYRLIRTIEDGELYVLVVRIGNRREVYR